MSKKLWLIFTALILIGLIEAALIWWRVDNPQPTANGSTSNQLTQNGQTALSFNKQQFSTDGASSIWAVVNKGRQLPSNYVPADLVTPSVPLRLKAGSQEMYLRSDSAVALEQLVTAANAENIKLMLASGYRSYTLQTVVYNNEVKSYGRAQADRESARPGHSEHQTGLAADLEPISRICELAQCFANTAEGQWLAANAYKFSFIIRYPSAGESSTGYMYEPWHIRFVGTDLAAEIQKNPQTLEQFFNLPSYASYPGETLQLR